MPDREKIIKALDEHLHCSGRGKSGYCPYSDDEFWNDISDALTLLEEQNEIVRCKDCKNWIPGCITDTDEFIPPKCGKYQQMVGHSSDDFCSLAERSERVKA